jgi:hypothetical protein
MMPPNINRFSVLPHLMLGLLRVVDFDLQKAEHE